MTFYLHGPDIGAQWQ